MLRARPNYQRPTNFVRPLSPGLHKLAAANYNIRYFNLSDSYTCPRLRINKPSCCRSARERGQRTVVRFRQFLICWAERAVLIIKVDETVEFRSQRLLYFRQSLCDNKVGIIPKRIVSISDGISSWYNCYMTNASRTETLCCFLRYQEDVRYIDIEPESWQTTHDWGAP